MKNRYVKIALVLVVLFAVNQDVLAINFDSLKAQIVKDWQRAKAYTKTYLDIMPADKYTYTPVDTGKVRSFGGQMLHLAQGNILLLSNATGQHIDLKYPSLDKLPAAQSKDSVMYYVMYSYDYCIGVLNAMDANKLEEMVNSSGHSVSRFEWIMVGFEHQTHQRALCAMYIRLVGVKPPEEMLF